MRDLLAAAVGIIAGPKRSQYEREALIDSFCYADAVGLATVDLEILSSAHYHLMEDPYYWYKPELINASRILCSIVSKTRANLLYYLSPKALLTFKTVEACQHFDDKVICQMDTHERRVCNTCGCNRWEIIRERRAGIIRR